MVPDSPGGRAAGLWNLMWVTGAACDPSQLDPLSWLYVIFIPAAVIDP
jgi:hypothetical protein